MRFYQLLVQDSLVEHFRSVINAAIKSDTLYQLARNSTASKAKQAQGEIAITKINELRVENLEQQFKEGNTSKTLNDFIKLKLELIIDNYETNILHIIDVHDLDNVGSSSDAINGAKKIIENTMLICNDLNLLDTEWDDKSSLCIFQRQAINYLCSKTNHKIEPLTKEKIEMVTQSLKNCVTGFNHADGFPIDQLNHIKMHVEKSLTENTKLCEARSKSFNIPIFSGGFLSILGYSIAPSLTPGEGKLKDCLVVVLSQLDKLENSLLSQAAEIVNTRGSSSSNNSVASQLTQQSEIFVSPRESQTSALLDAAQLRRAALLEELSKPTVSRVDTSL